MPVAMAKAKSRIRFPPPSTSSHFQEALRLCHRDDEQDSWTDDERGASDDSRSSSSSSSSSSRNSHTKHHRAPSDPEVHHLERGALQPSSSDSDLPSGPAGHSSRPSCDRKLSLDARTSDAAGGQRRGSRRGSCDKKDGAPVHVQWADEQQQVLVREHPRKRYERKPSLRGADTPKPILKQS